MTHIDHYMVDYLGNGGDVKFANDTPIHNLTVAKAMAAKTSKQTDTGAYVVAFVAENGDRGTKYRAVGHISFFDGKQSSTDGVVL